MAERTDELLVRECMDIGGHENSCCCFDRSTQENRFRYRWP